MTRDEAHRVYNSHYGPSPGSGPAIRPQIFHLNFVTGVAIMRIEAASNKNSCWTEIQDWERHIRLYVASEMLCITDGVVP